MYFQPLIFVTGISLTLLSGVQAISSQYINVSTPISTPVNANEFSTTTLSSISTWTPSTSLPNISTWAPPNATLQSTTTLEEATKSTILPLPTLTSALLNTTSLHLYPNATITQNSSNSSTPSQAFNTTTPIPLYKNSTTTATATHSYFTTAQNTTAHQTSPTPAPVKLSPALPPTLNPHDPIILQPNRSVNLFFQAPPRLNSSEIPTASVTIPQMAYPAIVLDHSALISDLECDLKKLRLKFLHASALNTAEKTWTMSKFIMTSFHENCGRASRTGERDYLLVRRLKFDRNKLSVVADISHIGIVEAVGRENPITVDMGSYTPGSVGGRVGFDSHASEKYTVSRNGTAMNSTVSMSEDFDIRLDDKIGYTTLSSSSNIVRRFAGVDDDHALILTRGFFSCGWCKKVVKSITNAVKKVVTKFIPSWTLTPLDKNLNIALGGGNVITPFNGRKGYQIYTTTSGPGPNYLTLYCVDCGVSGVINVKATITFNLIGLITSGSFGVNGNMAAGLGLGVDANYAASVPAFSKTIVAIPLSPFAIPGLITIGPHLDLGVGASASINAKGNMFAGIYLRWNAIHAQLNLYSAPEASGWVPEVVPEFQAQGTIAMSASVYATVSLGFGVSILNGLKSFGVALVEKPELYIGGVSTNPSCRGLSLTAGFRNTVYADVFGSYHSLHVWNPESEPKCLAFRKRRAVEIEAPKYPVSSRVEARQIVTGDGGIGLHYADNGNIYALPQGNGSLVDMSTISFASTNEGILVGDVESRVFHGYIDTLSAEGVSRLRLSRVDHIPKTAVVITLQKSNAPESPEMLIALDAEHNIYYPIVCTFVGDKDFPKLFLAKDPEAGPNVLMEKENVGEITGAEVDACAFLPLVAA